MRALEFLLNGRPICVAAPGGGGLVMSSIVLAGSVDAPDGYEVRFRVGGVRDDQHHEWFHRSLELGDKVEIRIIDAPQSDSPVSIEPITDDQRERLRLASNENAT
jgi:hypothetical protein